MQRACTSLLFSTLSLVTFGCLIPSTAKAQVTPDGTTSTTVNQVGNDFTIEQGSRIGDNLFHSFNEFSVPTLGSATFNNAADIANIFSRVTGSNISNIDGLLRANGAANLFLINPNGIIFGENARLNLGGSFFATTADSLLFEGNTEFSASNPQAAPLLEVNIPIGLNFRDNPGDIVNRSTVENSAGNTVGLEVARGNNLTLVGGNINFEAGNTTASGGNIELGGLSTAGTVGINDDRSLDFPEGAAQADITLSNAADIDVRGRGGGNIAINASNLNLEAGASGRSRIRAGITVDSTSSEAQAGDIRINTTENITVDDSSISNEVDTEAVGNTGGVTITTGSLSLTNGGLVDAITFGQGNTGSVNITASDTIIIDGESSEGFSSGAASQVASEAIGNAGSVNITTGSFSLTNGGQVSTITGGQGNAGAVKITATDTIMIDGESSVFGSPSGVASLIIPGAVGDAEGVTITTGSLYLNNGGQVDASTFGQGNVGLVEITASDNVTIDGEKSDGSPSVVASQLASETLGDAQGVTITTGSLILTNGGQVDASTFGKGNAGSINIIASDTIIIDGEDSEGFPSGVTSGVDLGAVGDAEVVNISTDSLNLTNGGRVSTSTFGQGNAGSIKITANDILIDGENSLGNSSLVSSVVNSEAVGNTEGITITTGSLTLTNGGLVDASTEGQGNAGSVQITATDTLIIDGEDSEGFPSGVTSVVDTPAEGDAGEVIIDTASLTLTNGGRVSASTFSQGNAGKVTINASDTITIDGEDFNSNPSSVNSQVNTGAVGNAGDVTITTGSLSLTNGGRVNTNTFGQGNAGSVKIIATDTLIIDGEGSNGIPSGASSQVVSRAGVNAGGVTIITGSLALTNGGQVDASTFGQGNAGSVEINATDLILIDGESGVGSQVIPGAVGDAGGVTITTGSLSLTKGGQVSATTGGQGDAGSVKINATDFILIDGENSDDFPGSVTSQVATGAVGNAGGVTITTGSLFLINGGLVSASTSGQGNAGMVEITANNTITIDGEILDGNISRVSSQVSPDAVGDAGGVTITTGSLILTNGGIVDASTRGEGNAGSVQITAIDTIIIDGGGSNGIPSGITSVIDTRAEGDEGNVVIDTASLTLTNGGQVTTSTFGQGNAGDLTVNARESITIIGVRERFRSGISSNAFISSGNGGDVNVFTNQLTIDNSGSIEAGNFDSLGIFSPGTGQPGDINIEANSLSLSNQASIEAATQSQFGEAANINLTIAEDIILKNNSLISATALENANGGNVTINADDGSIVAFPNQNNDIIANANRGNGGEINITTQAIFGLTERRSTPPNQTNDIDASSQFGLQGNFSLNTPEVDPTSGLIELPEAVGDASDQVSQNPCEQGVGSEFTITGKGGIPPNPNETLNSNRVRVGLVEPVPSRQEDGEMGRLGDEETGSSETPTTEAVPVQGLIFNDKGEVMLTSYKTTDTEIERSPQKISNSCSVH